MFEFPSLLSLVSDIVIIILFVTLFELREKDPNFVKQYDLTDSSFVLVLLAALRIIILSPLLWVYYKGKQLKNRFIPYLWLLAHFAIIIARISFMVSRHNARVSDDVIVSLSILSIICQVLCVSHLRSSILPERHVVIAISPQYIKPEKEDTQAVPLLDHHTRLSIEYRNQPHRDRITGPEASPYERFLSSEFIAEMKTQLDNAQTIWEDKVCLYRCVLTYICINIYRI